MDTKQTDRSKVLFYVSLAEMQEIANLILGDWDQLEAKKFDPKAFSDHVKGYIRTFLSQTSAPDVAMFGRMLAVEPKLNIDAACQVAHAISTHRVNMEFDFFTAVDDLNQEDSGAGMMGMTGFNSACFYRYACIDFNQLVKNLNGNVQLARSTIEAFMRASVAAVPSGKQNSFAAHNPPAFLMAVTRDDGMGWSLANAFEKPVQAKGDLGLIEASVNALDAYWKEMTAFYGSKAKPVVGVIGRQQSLDSLSGVIENSLDAWVETVLNDLPKE
jgi:CRISPR system Cascade subunit CasC